MGLPHVVHGLATQIIFGACLAGLNLYLKGNLQGLSEGAYYGLFGIFAVITLILYLYVSAWNNVRTWWFYLTFIPVFATSCFDVFWMTDIFMEPNGVLLQEYISVQDPHVHNIYNLMFVLCNATLLHPINLFIIYRTSHGRSGRSFFLFSSLAPAIVYVLYVFCAATSSRPLHPLTQISLPIVTVYWLFPLGPLSIPRGFKFEQNHKPRVLTKCLRFSAAALLLATVGVFLAKVLVLHGYTSSVMGLTQLLSVVKKNDPMIFLDDVENTFPYAAVGIWTYIVAGLPTALVSLFYHFKSNNKKPLFLWELSIFQAALIVPLQFFFIVGPFFRDTPKELRLSSSGPVGAHLALNGIPVLASIFQILSLLPFRVADTPVASNRTQELKKRL